MYADLIYDNEGKVQNSLSAYQPPLDIQDLTKEVRDAYEIGQDNINAPNEEYNGRSFVEEMNVNQRAWLSWTPDPYEGEDDWRWNGVRPITRNRVISTAAHLTAQLLVPNIFAQNESDEEDRAASYVMCDLVEYNIRRSNYDTAFLFGVISGLVNPVAYFNVEYVQAWQEMWQEDKKEKVIDDVFSGFQHGLKSPDEILFSSRYQFEWQKQDWIIEKELITYGEAQALYGDHANFEYVQAGKRVIMSDDNLFYDVEDEDELVEKITYKNRRKDLEVCFLGGVYMGGDNSEYNPFIHRSNKNKPKYNTVKFGYEPIDSMRFVGYKSLVAKMANDQEAVDRQWQMYFDATFLSTFPPTITMGAGKIDRSVIAPATNTELGENAKIEPLQIANPNAAVQALYEAERSLTESSQDPQLGGEQGGTQKTARESILLQQNAQTNLGIAAKMIARMVKDVGELMVDDIIRYQTIGEVSEITGKTTYKTFLLDGKVEQGANKTSYIRFTDRYAGSNMSKEDKEGEEYRLMEEAGDDKEIHLVNPYMFSRMDFLITIDAERMLQKNEAFERAFKLETYDRAIANPLVAQDPETQEKITRDFLFEPLMGGEASKYLPRVNKANFSKVAQSLAPPGNKPGKDMPQRMVESAGMEQLSM